MKQNTPPHKYDMEPIDLEMAEVIVDDEPEDSDEDDDTQYLYGEFQNNGAAEEIEDDNFNNLEEISEENFPNNLKENDLDVRRTADHDDAELVYENHTAAIFSCDLHPTLNIAVSGSEDDSACVWCTKTGVTIDMLDDHTDTITETHFNFNGKLLAVGDMSGQISVFKIQEKTSPTPQAKIANQVQVPLLQIDRVWQFSMGDMAWLRWHNSSNVLFAGAESGEIYMWRIPSGECKVFPGPGERCVAGCVSHDGRKLFATYAKKIHRLWDLKANNILFEINENHPMCQLENVNSLAVDKNRPMYATGADDGRILLCNNDGPVSCLEGTGQIESLDFCPDPNVSLLASGSISGEIGIWDYGRQISRFNLRLPEENDGVIRLKWIGNHTLIVGTIFGYIYVYNALTGLLKKTLDGHTADIYELCYREHDNIMLSASEDGSARIFLVPPSEH